MKKQILVICFGIIIALLMTNLGTAITNITGCTTINSSGNYQLVNNITNHTSGLYGCIEILANNVTLDGQNYMLNMSAGYGITSYNGTKHFSLDNIVVKNFLLYTNTTATNLIVFGNTTNNTIIDNITIINSSTGSSIVFDGNAYNLTISKIYRYLQ
jgi:hypothetical protein